MVKLSLVVPCYNEGENVIPFHEAALNAFRGCGYEIEIVYIDDGSRDATLHNLKKIYARKDCRVKIVSFSRNFGKEAGIYAGLQHASGEYVSLIDADLQQRPEIVRDMVNILDEKPEYDIVAAYQDRRNEGKVLSFFKKSFYKEAVQGYLAAGRQRFPDLPPQRKGQHPGAYRIPPLLQGHLRLGGLLHLLHPLYRL